MVAAAGDFLDTVQIFLAAAIYIFRGEETERGEAEKIPR